MANLTRTFLQSVLSSTHSSAIYKAFVKDDKDAQQIVKKPSFYPEAMFVWVPVCPKMVPWLGRRLAASTARACSCPELTKALADKDGAL